MGFLKGLLDDVKSEVGNSVSREIGYSTRRAVSGTIDSVTGGIKTKMATRGQWKCICGSINKGKFCMDCGKEKGAGTQCVNCGWKATDKIPRFCPECGEDFDGDENT